MLPTAEYRAIVSYTDKLVTGISAETLTVTNKLITEGLISPWNSSLQGNEQQIASILVKLVTLQIELNSQTFQVFLNVLRQIIPLNGLAKQLEEACRKIKEEELEQKVEEMSAPPFLDDIELRAPLLSDEKQTLTTSSPDKATRFPYLNAETLTEKQKERLEVRLESDSDKQKNKFAILVDETRESLERHNVACNDLSVLVRHSTKNRLFDLIQESKSIRELFLGLADYWSFFDYEFLSLIIERFCKDLKPDLSNYESSLKDYCRRRLCELPDDVFVKKGDGHNLYVKIDSHFNSAKVEDIKKLEDRLSELLETELYVLKVEEGCIFVTFNNLCDISTPLSPYQVEKLKEMRVLHLYSDNEVYFNSTCTVAVGNCSYMCGTYGKAYTTKYSQLLHGAKMHDLEASSFADASQTLNKINHLKIDSTAQSPPSQMTELMDEGLQRQPTTCTNQIVIMAGKLKALLLSCFMPCPTTPDNTLQAFLPCPTTPDNTLRAFLPCPTTPFLPCRTIPDNTLRAFFNPFLTMSYNPRQHSPSFLTTPFLPCPTTPDNIFLPCPLPCLTTPDNTLQKCGKGAFLPCLTSPPITLDNTNRKVVILISGKPGWGRQSNTPRKKLEHNFSCSTQVYDTSCGTSHLTVVGYQVCRHLRSMSDEDLGTCSHHLYPASPELLIIWLNLVLNFLTQRR